MAKAIKATAGKREVVQLVPIPVDGEYQKILQRASKEILNLKGDILDVLDIKRPDSKEYAAHLARIVSKISPLLGNMIEYSVVEKLNKLDWKKKGKWIRQDPGFPDTLFDGKILPKPGVEIKTWFPLATEITARFKDSISHFKDDQTHLAVVAWLPEYLIYGKPKILDVWVGSAKSLAIARDVHYHKPPDYLVFEPEDTSGRTSNLQQTNTNGYKFQGTPKQLAQARKLVSSWGKEKLNYSPDIQYQKLMRTLLARFPYRLDTNFAKIDRIEHASLEEFKSRVLKTEFNEKTVKEWATLISGEASEETLQKFVEDII